MAHMMANVFVGFDDRHINIYMGPSAQKHTLDDFNADNFDHKDVGFIRGSQISIGTGNLQGGPIASPRQHRRRRAALGCGLSRLPRAVLHPPRRDGRADREPALRRPDDRSRSQCARRLGLAGAAADLRLAAAERARARRVHAEEDGGDRPRDGCARRCGGRRSARPARRARITRAARAWAAIRRPRS